ncbi:MAG TPA: ATP-binding protein [Pyrinomonadaceae bacterium]|nr:ATP-binding protein [Pyrinomonadaceae bacterium]
MKLNKIFLPYNPWWQDSSRKFLLPEFKRPIFHHLYRDLKDLPQMISITGPRRIGKSTLLLQLIDQLLSDGIAPEKLVYYSFDDPALETSKVRVDELIDTTMKLIANEKSTGPTYLFLDEIQKLDRWELYLKKYYDLKYPIRVVVSGSASSPIFKKSRESLLGRVKDHHLLPFSFREYVLYNVRGDSELTNELEKIHQSGEIIQAILTEDPNRLERRVSLPLPSENLKQKLNDLLNQYFLEGGFPEVWNLPTWVAKQEYLYDNQVKKVIYEDLLLAAEFRKPELLKRFYISLLERPGQEVAVNSVSQETLINASQIEKYIPLLEMTDLIYKISKFRPGALRVRKGNLKFYLVDLALRNAVLRLTDTLLEDNAMLGLYAENLVFLTLRNWRGTIQMDYYRERDTEVDFIVHVAPNRFLPIEVKYRNQLASNDFKGIKKFVSANRKKCTQPLIVSKNWSDYGTHDYGFCIPLPIFLLLFD